MIPDAWSGPAFPPLMMGDANASATLYYWNGSRGGAVLSASGRTTVHPMVGASLDHRASYDAGRWSVTMSVPDQPDGYPLAFALWDGAQGDRDGLKFFSIWYVLTTDGGPKG
jgi:DMSO reductase family type II enzyme heme b subunit